MTMLCKRFLAGTLVMLCGILYAGSAPDYPEMRKAVRQDHPRLFINRDDLPRFVERAKTVCRADLEKLKRAVDAYPDHPKLEFLPQAKVENGIISFPKMIGDQDLVFRGLKRYGGAEAAECTLLYVVTKDAKYKAKALQYLRLLREACELSERSKMALEWYNTGRLNGFLAYDWLYNDLTPEERKEVLLPLYRHLEFMRTGKHHQNRGGADSGNYGEKGLWWYAGLAAAGDGIADELAEKYLRDGYKLNCACMDYRDRTSGDTGALSSICTGYALGFYPFATNNFLHTLRSAAGIDGTKFWKQPEHFTDFIDRLCIPNPASASGFSDYAAGDSFHVTNEVSTWLMYTHLAQLIHFYGESPAARRIMAQLPTDARRILGRKHYPFLPYILTKFDPNVPATAAPASLPAAHYPYFGFTVMRSGTTPEATYAAFKGGSQEPGGHQHYDENSFVIYKKGFQALDTGTRCSTLQHIVYYPQTVAHNSILIRDPGEPLAPHWCPVNISLKKVVQKYRNDGGQCRKGVSKSLGIRQDMRHVICGADATPCYHPGKCREAVRQFVFILPDYFVIYDRVTSVRPDQQKVFLWHTQNRMTEQNGVWRGEAEGGALFLRTLLPEKTQTAVIGGPEKEFWTNGANFPVDDFTRKQVARNKGKNWLGAWRLEISPAGPQTADRFLTVLQAADSGEKTMIPVKLLRDRNTDGVEFTTREGKHCVVKFNRTGAIGETVQIKEVKK